MKKFVYTMLIVLAAIAVLAACAPPVPDGGLAEEEDDTAAVSESVMSDDFSLTIEADKKAYQDEETIDCFATLQYLGDAQIMVYHADPLVAFSIEGGKFGGGYARDDVLSRTTFEPGDELKLPFQKSGGWSADDPDAAFYEAFYAEETLNLPPGEYTLSAIMEYSTDENDVRGTLNTLTATVTVTVEE